MAQTLRLTYFFYSTTSAPSGTKVTYTTRFPFIKDEELVIFRSFRQSDVDLLYGGKPPPDGAITNYGTYDTQNWFFGLGINGIVVNDGLNKKPNGIVVTLSKDTNGNQIGVAEIDTKVYPIGLLDKVEICVISAKTTAPWVYYGLIPERAAIAAKFGRNSSGMGGFPESFFPAQAAQMTYFVNVNLDNQIITNSIPFPSVFLVGMFGVGGSSGNVTQEYFMADILNGDGSIAVRSCVNFVFTTLGMDSDIGGFSVSNFNIIRADNYKTINYRELSYSSVTQKEKQVIDESTLYVAFEVKDSLNDFYLGLSSFFNIVLKNFINFTNVKFLFYRFSPGSSSISIDGDFSNDAKTISDLMAALPTTGVSGTTPSLSFAIDTIKNKILSDAQIDIAASQQAGPTTTFSRRYGAVVVSDMFFADTELSDITTKSKASYDNFFKNLEVTVGSKKYTISADLMGGIVLTGNDKEVNDKNITNAQAIFGDKLSSMSFVNSAGSYGFQFLGILGSVTGTPLTELNIFDSLPGIDANSIKKHCKYFITPGNSLMPGSQDFDGDGQVTLLDRLRFLYQSFNPNEQFVADPFYSFWSEPGSEMRYWRKVCPIGMLFRFSGKILSVEAKNGTNHLLKIEIVWKDNKGVTIPYTGSTDPNVIYAYVENGAKSNLTGWQQNADTIVEFQGRLFFPKYFVNVQLGGGNFKFNNASDLTSWYRLRLSTSQDLIDLATTIPDEPILVVRTNIDTATQSAADTSQTVIPSIFQSSAIPEKAFYKLSQLTEEINDHVFFNDYKVFDAQPTIGQSAKIFETSGTSNVAFYDIQFDVETQGTAGDKNNGLFEYEIGYRPSGSDQTVQLYKFWSGAVLPGTKGTVSFNASRNLTFICSLVPKEDTSSQKNRLFNIDFPYTDIPVSPNRYSFTWDQTIWKVASVQKDGKDIRGTIDNSLVDGSFGGQYKISPSLGQILLKDPIDPNKDFISVVFQNISGGQKLLKIGNQLYIGLIRGVDGMPTPKITNVKVNGGATTNSMERVDVDFDSTAKGGSYHLIAPTEGYVIVGAKGWSFNIDPALDNGKATGGGKYGTVVYGDLVSPFFYFDAFASNSDLAHKLVDRGANKYDFPALDIVYGTLVNSTGKPFMQIRAIGFTPPPPPSLLHVASTFSRYTDRFTLIYNNGERINQKYSFIKFRDRNTDPGYSFARRSLRSSVPVYAGITDKVDLFDGSADQAIFNVQQSGKILVGLSVTTDPVLDINDQTQPLELYSSAGGAFQQFGYTDSNGVSTSQWIPVYSNIFRGTESSGQSYAQIADSTGITQIRVQRPDADSEIGPIKKVVGEYVDALLKGRTPELHETNYGEYLLYFTSGTSTSPVLSGLISYDDAQRWKRPGVDAQSSSFGTPIPILTGFSNPKVLKDRSSDNFYIFLFNHTQNSIDMVVLPRTLFAKITSGQGEGNQTASSEQNNVSISDLTLDNNVNSWAQVFQSGQHIFPILFDAGQFFSAALSDRGTLYLASMSNKGEFRIKYNPSFGGHEFKTINWFDFGVNLFADESFLGQFVKTNPIRSVSLVVSGPFEILYLFISTDNKLILYKLPEAISKPNYSNAPPTDEVSKQYQDFVNQRKPILVVGKRSDVSTNTNIISTGSIDEDFLLQIVSGEITEDGIMWLFYLDKNQSTRCIFTETGGEKWSKYNNV